MARLSAKTLIIDLLIIFAVPFLFTAGLGIYGAIRPAKMLSDVVPEQFGYDYANVTLVTEDGLDLAGWFIQRKGPATDKAIVVLHGYPADKGDLLSRSAFLIDRYNVLFIDFRYFGMSAGKYTSVGARETRDLRAAVEYLQGQGMKHIGVYGFSMGAAVALMGQAEIDGIDAVAAEASYANLEMMTNEMYRYLGPLKRPLTWVTDLFARTVIGTSLAEVSPENAVRESTTPLLVIHSREDHVIPFENAQRIFMAMENNPDAERLIFDTGDHGEPSIELAQRLNAFYAAHIGLPDDLYPSGSTDSDESP